MVRIAGINLDDKWRVDYALTHIKGVGWSTANKVIDAAGLKDKSCVSELTNDDIAKIVGQLEGYVTEGDLIRKVREDIQRLKTIGSYRGLRHGHGLPVRGQRTKSNARTKRGKRRTVGAFRKDALAKTATAKKE